MLRLDLARLSDLAIKKIISERCARMGRVTDIALFRPTHRESYPFALVDMSTAGEVQAVAREIGEVVFGFSALIRLVQGADADGTTRTERSGSTLRRPLRGVRHLPSAPERFEQAD